MLLIATIVSAAYVGTSRPAVATAPRAASRPAMQTTFATKHMGGNLNSLDQLLQDTDTVSSWTDLPSLYPFLIFAAPPRVRPRRIS